MKKGFILFVALTLLASVAAFAKVTAVKDGDAVKVTWTYTNADAGSVGLVGDFNGWNLAAAQPLTKGADGVWTITLTGKADSEYKYKFNVDGEWTEDPEAPTTLDDGFGGLNGYAVVASLLDPNAAAAAGPSFVFSNFTSARIVAANKWDAAGTGTKDSYDVNFKVKSFWKIQNAKLWESLTLKKIEIAMDDATYGLYDATKATNDATPFAHWLISPFNTNKAKTPYLGHWVIGTDTPVGDLTWYAHYAKPGKRAAYIWQQVSEVDALAGFVELEKTGLKFGDVSVDYLLGFGPSSRGASKVDATGFNHPWDNTPGNGNANGDWWNGYTGFYGSKTFVDVTIAGQTFGGAFNTVSNVTAPNGTSTRTDLASYFDVLSTEAQFGAKGKVVGLKYALDVMSHNYFKRTYDAGKYLLLAGTLDYSVAGIDLGLAHKTAGDGIHSSMFWHNHDKGTEDIPQDWGDNGGNRDRSITDVTVAYTVPSLLKAGAKVTIDGDNMLQSGAELSNTSYLAVSPFVEYYMGDNTVRAEARIKNKTSTSVVEVGLDVPFIGLVAKLKKLGVETLDLGLGYESTNNWTTAATDDKNVISFLAQAGLGSGMDAQLGLAVRGGQGYTDYYAANKWTKDIPVGLNLGFSKKFDGKGFSGPQFYAQYHFNLDLWEDNDKNVIQVHDTYYIKEARALADGWGAYWKVVTGFKWDF